MGMEKKQGKKEKERKNFKELFIKAAKGTINNAPLIIGVVLLTGLLTTLFTKQLFEKIFTHGVIIDSFIGSIIGSIFAGNPINSYIIGGELLKNGVSLVVVTAFLLAWVTVGIVQYPLEARFLGKKFALIRNITAFLLSIILALIIVTIYNLI